MNGSRIPQEEFLILRVEGGLDIQLNSVGNGERRYWRNTALGDEWKGIPGTPHGRRVAREPADRALGTSAACVVEVRLEFLGSCGSRHRGICREGGVNQHVPRRWGSRAPPGGVKCMLGRPMAGMVRSQSQFRSLGMQPGLRTGQGGSSHRKPARQNGTDAGEGLAAGGGRSSMHLAQGLSGRCMSFLGLPQVTTNQVA